MRCRTDRRDEPANNIWSNTMKTFNRFMHAFCILAVSCLLPAAAFADTNYERLVVFGDSLSDPGNAYVLTGMSLVPPYTDLVPEHPYARGGHHLSNGSTWIEQLARRMKLLESVGPALRVPGVFSNYAVDRTRACAQSPSPSYIDLSGQVGMFLDEFGGAPAEALYVVFVGGNDVRDALTSQDPPAVIGCALYSIYSNLIALIDAGARTFLVANVPNLGQVPAVALLGEEAQAGATGATFYFNQQLEEILMGIEAAYHEQVSFYRLDTFGLITQASISHPELNVTDPCIDIFTGMVCAPAEGYLFWDGIHPTVTGHALIAEEAASVLGLSR
jgi:phospholipase/lecithinase/hemolysin